MAKKLPDELFVAWRDLPNDKPYLVAETTPSACLEDDGPLRGGTRFVSSRRNESER